MIPSSTAPSAAAPKGPTQPAQPKVAAQTYIPVINLYPPNPPKTLAERLKNMREATALHDKMGAALAYAKANGRDYTTVEEILSFGDDIPFAEVVEDSTP